MLPAYWQHVVSIFRALQINQLFPAARTEEFSVLFAHIFRDNLDWLARATNWDKLSATASLGVIHRGHEKDSLALMQRDQYKMRY